jgi:hypothetical protein
MARSSAWSFPWARNSHLDADLKCLTSDVRAAASDYARDAGAPDINELNHEIAALERAAERRQYAHAASLRANLSPEALAYLKARLDRPGPRASGWWLPSAEDLVDQRPTRQLWRRNRAGSLLVKVSRRDESCEMIGRLCRTGGKIVEGRKRQTGKRSRPTFLPLLYAPELQRHLPKLQAELIFVASLATAWLRATGKPPAMTANRRALGPFARFVRCCLDLVGARQVNAVNLINKLGGLRTPDGGFNFPAHRNLRVSEGVENLLR